MLRYITTLLLFFVSCFIFSQNIFSQNTLKGRVSVRAFGIYDSSTVFVPLRLGDLINKAFLISTNIIFPINTTSYLNGDEVSWNLTNQITNSFTLDEPVNNFQLTQRIHVIDVSSLIEPTDSIFTLYTSSESLIPLNSNYSNPRYHGFTLFLEYKNNSNSIITSSIILNDLDATSVINYKINSLPQMNNVFPVGLSLSMGIMAANVGDGSFLYVNNDSIGLVFGDECCRPSGLGAIGQYDYYNNTLHGVGDDTADSLMNGPDLLADIKSYVNYGDTQLNIESRYESPNVPHLDPTSNPIWATFLTYSTKCDTLHSYLTTADTTICAGEVLNLAVGGDSTYTYAWRYRGNTISTDSLLTIAPQQNRLYSILVSDTNGCSKTEIINIKVNPKPSYRLTTTNAICPNNNGVVVMDSLQGVAPPYRFRKGGGAWQTAPVYANLPQGNYQLEVVDTNGCITSQLATITSINKTNANFSLPTPLPFVPTSLNFTNQSQFASEYQWFINGNLVSTTTNLEQAFEEAGAYAITLVASSTNEQCTDTITKTINLERENFLYIPSSWVKETDLSLTSSGYVQLEFRLVNSLGQVVRVFSTPITSGEQSLLGNKTLARGVYFYQLTATKQTGEVVEQSGKVVRL